MKRDRIQFIVPTLKRVQHLTLCIESVLGQSIKPDQIYVGIKDNDTASIELISDYSKIAPVTRITATGVGVVGSMASCLVHADADFIALLDDDVELPPHWLDTMLAHMHQHPDVVGCSGRDMLQDHPEKRRSEAVTMDVGSIHWYGRITGNHHRGAGGARKVDVLRGSNILFRGGFLKRVGFMQSLRGQGAQVNWELALAYQAKAMGHSLCYDPTVIVIHHTAPRHDSDSVHRGIFSREGIVDMSFNETLVTVLHAPFLTKLPVLIWQILIGSKTTPGMINAFRILFFGQPNAWGFITATVLGRWLAWVGKR